MANYPGDMTDELEKDFGSGGHITRFVSGGPKQYSYQVWSTKQKEVLSTCKSCILYYNFTFIFCMHVCLYFVCMYVCLYFVRVHVCLYFMDVCMYVCMFIFCMYVCLYFVCVLQIIELYQLKFIIL